MQSASILHNHYTFYTVPSPNVTITTDTTDNFTRGTERYITCTITLTPPSPMSTNVTLEWRQDGVTFDNSSDRVIEGAVQQYGNTHSSTITFSPLNTTDTGTYECVGTISNKVEDDYIINSTNTGSLSLTVEGIRNYKDNS